MICVIIFIDYIYLSDKMVQQQQEKRLMIISILITMVLVTLYELPLTMSNLSLMTRENFCFLFENNEEA